MLPLLEHLPMLDRQRQMLEHLPMLDRHPPILDHQPPMLEHFVVGGRGGVIELTLQMKRLTKRSRLSKIHFHFHLSAICFLFSATMSYFGRHNV